MTIRDGENLRKVPFHSQKWDLSQWKKLGFKSEDEARYWERSCCGILCLRMAAEYFLRTELDTASLINQGLEVGAYTDRDGWRHSGLCELAEKLGLRATSGAFSCEQLEKAVQDGGLAIISIKWAFEPEKSIKERVLFWRKYGGHLALVVGVKKNGAPLEGFYIHHTSIHQEYNWPARFIPLDTFKAGYTGRAITVSPAILDQTIGLW